MSKQHNMYLTQYLLKSEEILIVLNIDNKIIKYLAYFFLCTALNNISLLYHINNAIIAC